jgi:hypothetical protein
MQHRTVHCIMGGIEQEYYITESETQAFILFTDERECIKGRGRGFVHLQSHEPI